MGAHGHCTKSYDPSSIKTQLKLVFLLFWGQLGCQGNSGNFCNFAKASYKTLLMGKKYILAVTLKS